MPDEGAAYVAFDVDRIKEFVFAGHRPLDAMGASELVKQLDVEPLRRSGWLDGFTCEVVYAAGGSGLIRVTPASDAQELARTIERRFRELTLTGSCTAVAVGGPAAASGADAFRAMLRELAVRLRRRKNEKAGDERPEAWAMGYLPRCAACAARVAERYDDPSDEWICASCSQKRQTGRDVRERDRMAESLADVAGADETRDSARRVAVLYADVNRAGRLLADCGSKEEVAALSAHLWQAQEQAILRVRRRWPGRYQSLVVGGDDLLVVIPAEGCLDLAIAVWDDLENTLRSVPVKLKGARVGEAVACLTLSVGLLVADHHLPVPFLVEIAQDLLRSAREIAYEQNESAIDFLLLTGGAPLASSVRALRETFLYRRLPAPEHFPDGGRLVQVAGVSLTRRPYPGAQFRLLVRQASEVSKRDQEGAVRRLAQLFETGRPMEAAFNVFYQRARHERLDEFLKQLEAADPEVVRAVATEGGNAIVTTKLLDLVEVMQLQAG